MRRQRYLRTSSAQSLCVFCSCRLTGDLPPALYASSRRGLKTGQTSRQHANVAVAEASDDTSGAAQQPPRQRQWSGFDPNSSLSSAEQAERARLRQLREERERAQRESHEAQQRQHEDARLLVHQKREAELSRARAEWQKSQADFKAAEDSDAKVEREQQPPKIQERRTQNGGRIRKFGTGLNSADSQKSPQGSGGREQRRQDDTRQEAQRKNRQTHRSTAFAHNGDARRNGIFQAQSPAKRDNPFASAPAKKVVMPSFGSSRASNQEVQRAEDEGWGSGPVLRAPLKYSDEPIRRNDHVLAERPSLEDQPDSNIATARGSTTNFGYEGGFDGQERPRPQDLRHDDIPSARQQRAPEQDPLSMWEEQQQSPPPPRHSANNSFVETLESGRRGDLHAGSAQQSPLRAGQPLLPQRVGRQRPDTYTFRPGNDRSVQPERRSLGQSEDDWPTSRSAHKSSFDRSPQSQSQGNAQYSSSRRTEASWNDNEPLSPTRNDAPPSQQRQRISADSIGSYQPLPPRPEQPPQGAAMYNNSGYQATMLDAQDYQQTPADFNEAQTAEWQHLRRRNSASAQAPSQQAQPQYQQQRQARTQYQDANWIDQRFNEHVQQRQQQQSYPAYLDQGSPFQQQPRDGPFDLARTVQNARPQRCARCLEIGHSAKECDGPEKRTCNLCGQVGHLSTACPSSDKGNARYRHNREQGQGVTRRTRSADPFEDPFPGGERQQQDRRQVPDRFAAKGQQSEGRASDRFSAQEESRPVEQQETGGAVADMRERVLRGPRWAQEAADEDEDAQQNERLSRTRKAQEDISRRERGARGGRRRDEDEEDDDEAAAAREEAQMRKAARKAQKAQDQVDKAADKRAEKARRAEQGPPVTLSEYMSVATLAQTLNVRYEQFVTRLERLGYDDVFPGKILNAETSGMIAMEYGFNPTFGEETAAAEEEERDLKARPSVDEQDKDFLPTRPPVVTIMGHVDHGKTTILDYLRKSSVAAGEAGGITQHIGAFSVPLASSGKTITFLDTPGHAAFLAMRQRGANVTDIVILVVAADDSVKPQTLEAIKHAKAAGVPMIVAVNKIDKEEADLQRVKQDLARHGVEIEDFGGETQVVPVSGKTGLGMDELEENVVTLSEILDHRAETEGAVEGWVLEATTKKAGRVATVLVRRGTLKPGAIIVAGKTWARVRTLRNEAGQNVREVGPGMPVEVDGWRDQPAAGDEVLQADSESKATDVVEYRVEKEESLKTAQDMEAINEARRLEQEKREKEKAAEAAKRAGDDYFEISQRAEEASAEERQSGQMIVPFIIKADVSGSAEAVSAYILSVASPLIAPQVLKSQVGPLNQSDVELASAAQGHIIAFNLPADEGMKGQAESKGVKVLENNIIYRVLDDVKAVLEDKLPPIVSRRVLGEAEISAAFEISVGGRKKMKIAGCKVRNGVVGRGSRVRVTRGSDKIYDGLIDSLKNVKKDVQEMRKGTECGMGFEGWEAFDVGDQIQTYEEISERRRL